MNLPECYRIGRIIKPHGIKGNLSVYIDPEAPENFVKLKTIYAEKKKRLIPLFVKEVVVKGNKAYMHFEDIDSLEEAEGYRQSDLYLPLSSRPKPKAGEFYNDEVIGFAVTDKKAGMLGKVKEVTVFGPNKMLVIAHADKEILIPVSGPFINKIIRSSGDILVDLPEGFLEI